MPVLLDQVSGESIVVEVQRTPVDLPASLPTVPVEQGLPPARQRYRGPTVVEIGILLARIPGDADDPDTVVAFIDRAAREARRLTYTIGDEPAITDLLVGGRSVERSTQTTSRVLSVVLQEVGQVSRATSPVDFPNAAEPDVVQGVEDGGRQSGQEGPAPGILASLLGVR